MTLKLAYSLTDKGTYVIYRMPAKTTDHISQQEIRSGLTRAIMKSKHLLLDFSNTAIIDSSVVGSISNLARGLKINGRTVSVCNVKEKVDNTFRRVNLYDIVEKYTNETHYIQSVTVMTDASKY